MKKYAIVQLLGKQFQVIEGDQLIIDRLDKEEGEKFDITDVLLVKSDKELKIGQPLVDEAKVKCKVVKHQRAKKIRVARFKAKSRYRKVYGHKQPQTVVEIVSIS